MKLLGNKQSSTLSEDLDKKYDDSRVRLSFSSMTSLYKKLNAPTNLNTDDDKQKFFKLVQSKFGSDYDEKQIKEITQMLWAYHLKLINAQRSMDKNKSAPKDSDYK